MLLKQLWYMIVYFIALEVKIKYYKVNITSRKPRSISSREAWSDLYKVESIKILTTFIDDAYRNRS